MKKTSTARKYQVVKVSPLVTGTDPGAPECIDDTCPCYSQVLLPFRKVCLGAPTHNRTKDSSARLILQFRRV